MPAPRLVRRSGFSIVELMLAVAIIGVLAALAVTQFREYQQDAKRAELQTNLKGIYDTVTIFHLHRGGDGLIGNFNPSRATLGKDMRPWNSGVDAATVDAWETLGWKPDGEVRCSYFFEDYGYPEQYYARGVCDIDVDDIEAESWWWGPGLRLGADKITEFNPYEF